MFFRKQRVWNTLDDVLNGTCEMLHHGARAFNHPWHWPVLGTLGDTGVCQRTVILRSYERADRILICHSDLRAEKIRQIRNDARIGFLFYDSKEKIQLRVSGTATIHTDDPISDAHWKGTSLVSRMNYCTTEPPGAPLERPESGLPEFVTKKAAKLTDGQAGRENFAAICCRFDQIDWLKLGLKGHRRARFFWWEDRLDGSWVVP
jgi:hypothetical protein